MEIDTDKEKKKEKPKFISYKKVLLFGAESTGKSSFTMKLKERKFQENIEHAKEGKIINIIKYKF